MVLNLPYDSDSLDSEDDPWEIVDDEITPLAAAQNNDIAIAAAIPGGAEREPSLEADAPHDTSEDGQGGNGSSGVSSVTRDHPSVADGGVDFNNEEGDTLDEEQYPFGEEQEPAGSLSESDPPENPAKVYKGEETKDDSGGLDEPLAPPSPVFEEANAPGMPFAAAEGVNPLEPAQLVAEKADPRTASLLAASAPAAGLSENTMEEKTSDSSGLVDSLSGMGFDKERIEKAMGDLREAGEDIDADSVIGEITGERNDGRRTWDVIQSAARDFEQQHELRRRTQHCARTVGHSARELLSTARGESRRFRANFRETCDEADVRARTASTHVKYAASSAKDSMCRANEDYRIVEKVTTVAVVGGAMLLALGNPRAGIAVMAVGMSSVAAGEAMKNSSAQSMSAHSRDHGLREGLHLD